MVLAHIERDEEKPTQRMLARQRIRSGRPQPLPGPGVLASGNSIGTPALLPDGTIARESMMFGLEQFEIDYPNPRALSPAEYEDAEAREAPPTEETLQTEETRLR
jgi:NADH-quinone oxidoreductase subunit J